MTAIEPTGDTSGEPSRNARGAASTTGRHVAAAPGAVDVDIDRSKLLKRFLADWIYPRWRQILVTLALTACLAATTGAYPLIIKNSFDTLMNDKESGALPLVLAAIVIVTMARSIFLYLQTVATNKIVMRMTTDLQKASFAHLVEADYARLTRETPGHLVSRLTNDITFIQQAATAALNTAIRDTLTILVLVASMFYLDWMMSLIVLLVYPLAGWPIMVVGQKLRRVAKRTQRELGDMTSMLTEKLSGARLIKTFMLERYAASKVNDSFEQIFSLRMKAVRNRARLDPMLEALGGMAVAGVIAFAYWRISGGVSTIGDFMGFVSALLMAAQPIRGLGNLNAKVQEGLAAAERIYDLLDEKPTITDKTGAKELQVTNGAIRFDDVGFSYGAPPMLEAGNTATPIEGDLSNPARGAVAATHDIDAAVKHLTLDIPGGTTLAFVGRSGAGKSTVINLVPRLFDVTSGGIFIDGQNLKDVTVASLRRNISIVSQDVTLFDTSIRENIALGRLDASDDDIIKAAQAAAAHDFIVAQPEQYDTEIGDRGMRLSGGQRQRLALARAILKDAPILLLDEATSALDTESERLVQDALARFTKNRTTLVIAHRLSTVQNADLICVMEAGELVELGSHAELLARGGRYALLCQQQFVGGQDAGNGAEALAGTPPEA